MDFKALFQHQQRVLELELAIARERFAHYGLRGNAVEIAVRDFLEKHLPRALSAGTGEVVASEGDGDERRSGQIDVVVSNMLQPFVGARDVPNTFLLEGVHVAGEVKATLGRSTIAGELQKGRKFRALRARNVSRLVKIPKPDVWLSYYVFYRPYFLLTLETSTNWRAVLLEIMENIKSNEMIPLDGVFLLDKGIIIILSPFLEFPMSKKSGIPFNHIIKGKKEVGSIHIYSTDVPLALFMAWMTFFRTSFFEDQHPLGFYVEQMINASLSDIVIAETAASDAALSERLQNNGPFDLILDMLREEFPSRSTSPTHD